MTAETERVGEVLVAYDTVLRRPGCVLVAAALGASTQASARFPTETWLLSPTPDMRVYRATEEQLAALVAMTSRSPLVTAARIVGLTTAETIAAIADVQRRCPSDGDRSEAIDAPDIVIADSDSDYFAERAERVTERAMWGGAA